MINTTGELQFLLEGPELHKAIASSMSAAANSIETAFEDGTLLFRTRARGFVALLSPSNHLNESCFDTRFAAAALKFCLADSRNTGVDNSLAVLQEYVKPAKLPATAFPSLRHGLKIFLLNLWGNKAVLLPSVFSPDRIPLDRIENAVLKWLLTIDASLTEQNNKYDNRRLYYYGKRLLFTTTWHRPSDVSLPELADLHRAQMLYRSGLTDVVIGGGSQLPFTHFAAELLRAFPEETSFNVTDLARYSNWVVSGAWKNERFETFEPVSKAPASKPKADARSPRQSREKPKPLDQAQLIAEALDGNTESAVLSAFKLLQRRRPDSMSWIENEVPSYPGREHVDLATLAPLWLETFNTYLYHRKHIQGYRSDHDTISCLNLLADYLFFYLPWWLESNPTSPIKYPLSPRDFSRYGFVSRHVDQSRTELPETLLQLIALRRPSKDSASIAVHQLTRYFAFVGTHYRENAEIAGVGYFSPIEDSFDAPRIKKKNKTNKEIIPKHIYGHLLFYSYAVEEFGRFLEKQVLSDSLKLGRGILRTTRQFKCEDFGFVPRMKYRGKEIPLEVVPNVFTWAERKVDLEESGGIATVYIPHSTNLRLLITSLETGLRAQSVQWLDRSTWDSLNTNAPSDSYTFGLYVNTDKTKEEPWHTYVVHRVRALLQREQTFQAQFSDANSYKPVNYEGLDTSPFDPIRPLFRSPASAYPVHDSGYAKTWVQLMVDFESFYRKATGETHVRLYTVGPTRATQGPSPVLLTRKDSQTLYCPISIRAIHTPHACRATFATNRQGVLELSDVGDLIGHKEEITTAHYTKPTAETLQERLRDSDASIVGDYTAFDADAESNIRPDRADSTLARNFARDRVGTLKTFRFMPAISLWSTSEIQNDGEGLRLLKEGPMSRIRFRETHICPVGEECPRDIVEQIGGHRRCGSCPLAMKCIDHLPAIAAKKRLLLERIRFFHRRREIMERDGEPSTSIDEIWDELELDINELLGWELSESILNTLKDDATHSAGDLSSLHADRPDIVRLHLKRVTRTADSTQLILQRIADSNAYPSFSSAQVQAAAKQLKRRLLAGTGISEIENWSSDHDDVRSVAKMLSMMMKASSLSVSDIACMLDSPQSGATEADVKVLSLESNDS